MKKKDYISLGIVAALAAILSATAFIVWTLQGCRIGSALAGSVLYIVIPVGLWFAGYFCREEK